MGSPAAQATGLSFLPREKAYVCVKVNFIQGKEKALVPQGTRAFPCVPLKNVRVWFRPVV